MSESGRRGFFRRAVAQVIGPVAELIERKTAAFEPAPARPIEPLRIRPPGAVPEAAFVHTCQRCGACVAACPARAIVPLTSDDPLLHESPVIIPAQAACVICEGLQCTHVCPSGALQPLADPAQIRMGLAVVDVGACIRSAGESCSLCVDKCPIGPTALRFDDDGPPRVLADGCTGCGVCELYCPTAPKAIRVALRLDDY